MKKLFLILVSVFAMGSMTATAEVTKSQKELQKMAKQAAKDYKKQGWKVLVGALPMEEQLLQAYTKQYDKTADGADLWIIGVAQTVAEDFTNANTASLEFAKLNIVSQLDGNIESVIEADLANQERRMKEAVSVNEIKASVTEAIKGKLGTVTPIFIAERELSNGNVEVMRQVAYPSLKGLQESAEVAREKLRAKLDELREKLEREKRSEK